MSSNDQTKRRYWSVVTPMPAPELVAIAQMAEAGGVHGLFAPQVLGPPWIPLATAAGLAIVFAGAWIARMHELRWLLTQTPEVEPQMNTDEHG